ncbi:MAG: putative transrane protein of unknown function [Bacteroidetes bacterium]|nr:putative transrane protein of unknown function [Bacteroidota bacterium]
MTGAENYFKGEIVQCTIGGILALLSIGLAFFLRVWMKAPFYDGLSWPFIVLPVLLSMVCISVIIRAPKDIKRVSSYEINNREKLKTEELPRMVKVMKSFKVLMIVEISLILAGILCFFLFSSPFLKGISAGAVIQCIFLLIFDFLAEKRGAAYLEYLSGS